MHTNKTKEEDAVISVRLCGFQLENKVMSILEKNPLEGLFGCIFANLGSFISNPAKF